MVKSTITLSSYYASRFQCMAFEIVQYTGHLQLFRRIWKWTIRYSQYLQISQRCRLRTATFTLLMLKKAPIQPDRESNTNTWNAQHRYTILTLQLILLDKNCHITSLLAWLSCIFRVLGCEFGESDLNIVCRSTLLKSYEQIQNRTWGKLWRNRGTSESSFGTRFTV